MKSSTKTNQFFRAIMLMSRGTYKSTKEISEELDIDLRTIYRYIDDLKASEFFTLEQRGKRYRIGRQSLIWANATENMFLTDEESLELEKVLDGLEAPSDTLSTLKQKIRNTVGNYVAPLKNDSDSVLVHNVATIQRAVKEKRMCMLRGYSSLHSNSKSDRLVEPFSFLGSKNDVRCYELASKMNKTFKISRCDKVELLDVQWQFASKHKEMHTDIFHFSDETSTRVRLLLGNLSKTILLEEHPEAFKHLIPHPDGRWMLDAEYCSMKGIGRFYLGLFEDIEIVDSPEFKEYLTTRIKLLTESEKV